MSFQTGLSGLNAASRNLDVIGNNIANVNTVGMKSGRAEFSQLLAASLGMVSGSGDRGIGVSVAATSQQFTQGNINATGNDLDMAINGGGFFQLRETDGSMAYTRDGTFKLDKQGYIVTNTGARLMGTPTTTSGTPVSTTITPLRLPTTAPIPANATSLITAELNLDARVTYPFTVPGVTASFTSAAVTPFDYSTIPGSPATYTSSPIATGSYGSTAGSPATYTTGAISAADYSLTPATFSITPPGGSAFTVALNSNVTGAADMANAIRNAPGYASSGFTVVATNGNNPGSALMFTAGNNTASTFTMGGADAALLTTGATSVAGVSTTAQVDGKSAVITLSTLDFSNGISPQVDATLTTTNPITDFDYSGAGLGQFDISVDGGTTFYGITLTANYGSLAGLATEIQNQIRAASGNASFTVTPSGGNLVFTNTGSTGAIQIANEDLNASAAGFAPQTGAAGTAATGFDYSVSFLVDGNPVTLSADYTGNMSGLAAAIAAQLPGAPAQQYTISTGSNTLQFTATGSLTAVPVAANTGATASQQTNATNAGFVASSGIAGTAAMNTAASFTITPPGGTAFTVNVSNTSIASAADLATIIQNTAGYAASGFTVAVGGSGELVFTSANNNAGNFVIGGADPTLLSTGAPAPVAVAGVADDTSNNATFTVVGPGGTPITVTVNSNITSAADLAAAIQGTSGYAGSGFTVSTSATGQLVFTATAADTAGNITFGGANASLMTTGGTAVSGVTAVPSGSPIVPRSTYGTAVTAYDSQGVAFPVTLYFSKVAPTTAGTDQWEVYDSLTGPSVGNLVFDASGKLLSTTVGTITLTPPAPSIVPPFPVTLDLSKVTQYGSNFAVADVTQDGYAPGELVGVKVGEDGVITARYSNGQTQFNGIVTLADFRNVQGLSPIAGNAWVETFASGTPVLGQPGIGRFGAIRSGALEDSNVDLTKELVDMMTAQRAYQANAQTIKTQDQVLSTLVNMR